MRICNSREKFISILNNTSGVISDMDFSNLLLNSLQIEERVFKNCRFKRTCFNNSNLDAAEFIDCDLTEASFFKAFIECGYFCNCKCESTDFSRAHLMGADIKKSDWSNSNVRGANLLEIQAEDWIIDGMLVDENTAINEGEFKNVDWSSINVSKLNISLDQVKYFLDCTNGGKYLQVYENYSLSSIEKRENAILQELWNEYEKRNTFSDENLVINDLIFFSYASEQQEDVKEMYNLFKGKYQVWMDLELKKDLKLNEQIEQIISSCRIAVVFLSSEYLIKAWTRYEFGRLLKEMEKRDLQIIIVNLGEK